MWPNRLGYHADAFVYISKFCGPVGTDVQLKIFAAVDIHTACILEGLHQINVSPVPWTEYH